MNIFFSSDHHFFHSNILLPNYADRPFSSLDEMHKELIIRWNSKVQPADKIYVIGDFCFGTVDKIKSIVSELNGYKILILGNHDLKKDKMLEAGFDEVHSQIFIDIAGESVLLNHYPYRPTQEQIDSMKSDPDSYQLKNLSRRPLDNGQWLLHGHIHQERTQLNKMINLSVEMWDYSPVAIQTIEKMIKGGPMHLNQRIRDI